MRRLVAPLLVALSMASSAQTLARPGWAGSGMTVERWWPHAVFCEVAPGSLASSGDGSTLNRLRGRLEDLQTLGIDAVLLQQLEAQPGSAEAGVPAIDTRYGTLEDFDALVSDAVRHSMRILVTLRADAHGQSLVNQARFWLSRGVTGLALSSSDPGEIRLLRSALHSYVGDRILIADASSVSGASVESVRSSAAPRLRGPAMAQGDEADLLRIRLPRLQDGPGPLRFALKEMQETLSKRLPVPLLGGAGTDADEQASAPSAEVLATVLLGSGGAVVLPADSLDLEHANDAANLTVFAWVRQWAGLHRGNATMRSGTDIVLDHDADGALVWVRQARGAVAPIVSICNITGKPIRLSLVSDVAKLRLRGSFLRTIARSDRGMGAMPLREIVLPAFGVYVGELSR